MKRYWEVVGCSYEDLMRHFEEFAVGDELFSLVLLIGAYMNSTLMDSLMMRCALWSPERKIIRQMTLGKGSAVSYIRLFWHAWEPFRVLPIVLFRKSSMASVGLPKCLRDIFLLIFVLSHQILFYPFMFAEVRLVSHIHVVHFSMAFFTG